MAVTDGMTHWTQPVQAFAAGQIEWDVMGDALDRILGVNWNQADPTIGAALDRAKAARAKGTQTTPASTTLYTADIVQKYRAGGYGAPGSQKARDAAIVDLSKVWAQQGHTQDDAFAQATTYFNQSVDPTAGGVGGGGAAAGSAAAGGSPIIAKPERPVLPGTAGLPDAEAMEREFEIEQSAKEEGRGNLFSRFLASRLAGRAVPPVGARLMQRQAEPLSDMFEMQQGLGLLPEDRTFTDFLHSRGLAPVDPSVLRSLVEQSRVLLNTPEVNTEPLRVSGFRSSLGSNPERQFQLALRSTLPSVPRQLQHPASEIASRTFDQFNLGQVFGKPKENFLDFAKGGLAGRGTPADFTELVRKASGLLAGPESALLTPEQTAYRRALLEDPDEQFQLALQAALPNVAAPARAGFSKAAGQAFRRFQEERGMFTPFLPDITSRNFNFFPR